MIRLARPRQGMARVARPLRIQIERGMPELTLEVALQHSYGSDESPWRAAKARLRGVETAV